MSQFGTPSLVYCTYFGADNPGDVTVVRKMALDSKNRVLLTGYTLSQSFRTTGGDYGVSLVVLAMEPL